MSRKETYYTQKVSSRDCGPSVLEVRADISIVGCVWTARPAFEYAGRVYAERKISSSAIAYESTHHDRLQAAIQVHHPAHVATPLREKKKASIRKAVHHTPGHVSALDIIPGLNKVTATVVDPMHMVCIGHIKNFFKNVMYTGDKYHIQPRAPPDQGGSGSPTFAPSTTDAEVDPLDTSSAAVEALEKADDNDVIDDESSDEDPDDDEDEAGEELGADQGTRLGCKTKPAKKNRSLLTKAQRETYHDLLREVSVRIFLLVCATFLTPTS
jgi:hypothetical protein